MVRNKLLHLLLIPLGLLLALGGCAQDEPSGQSLQDSTTLRLDIAPELDIQELKALTIDTQGGIPQFKHDPAKTSWTTHCFLRSADGSKQAYAVVDWDVVSTTVGDLKLKMKGHTLTLLSSGSGASVPTPVVGEEWFISGITGGGKLNADRDQVDFRYDAALDDALADDQIRVPLAFGWTKFTVAGDNQTAPRISVRLKPLGSLFRVKVDNTNAINSGVVYVAGRVKVLSNALTQNGAFSYTNRSVPVEGELPGFDFGSGNQTATEEAITRAVEVSLNSSKDVLLWAYPRPSSHLPASGSFSTKIYLPHYHAYASDKTTMTALTPRSTAFVSGKGYRTTLFVYRPKMPTEYIVPRHLTASGGEFAPDDAVSSAGFFSFVDAQNIVATRWGGYHLPTEKELNAALFGYLKYDTMAEGPVQIPNDGAVTIGGSNYVATRLWGGKQEAGGVTTYYTMSLFQSPAYADMKFVVASRFEIEPNVGEGSQVRVASFFVHGGVDLAGDMTPANLSDSRYAALWTDARNSSQLVFPLSGLKVWDSDTNDHVIAEKGARAVFYTSNQTFGDFYTGFYQAMVNAADPSIRLHANVRLLTDE